MCPEKKWLVFGVVGVGFYFFDLVGVALGVCGDEKDKLVSAPLGADGAIGGLIAKTGRVFNEHFRFGAAFDEVVDGTLGRQGKEVRV